MPRIPLPPITDFDAYNKNTQAQYEALGRFVVAFESMVNEIRESAIDLLRHKEEHSSLIDIAFHHPALSAKPLFEIFRAVAIESVALPTLDTATQELDTFRGVFRAVATEYFTLVNLRNTLVHGTWQIGYSSDIDPNAENFILNKFRPTSDGLQKEKVPKRAFELLALGDRCDDVRSWIGFLHACVPRADRPFDVVTERFLFKDAAWQLKVGDDMSTETLPRKSQ